MNLGQIWWEIGGNLAVLDLGRHRPNMQFNICSCLVLAKLCPRHARVGLIHIFHVPSKAQPIPQRGKEGVVLPFVTWAGTGQACSSTFVHASSWPNTVLVMVRQNFSLFLTPRHGGVASVASQKPMPVPPRKKSCPCNAAGRLAFAY
jgi:hypothetical protein